MIRLIMTTLRRELASRNLFQLVILLFSDLLIVTEVGQQRSRITRLIITTAKGFWQVKTNFNLQFLSSMIKGTK